MRTQAEFLGHPKGLFVLFFTEMWERFSYYGMRALLVLYMTQHLFESIQNGQNVLGFETVKGLLESLYGPLSDQALSSQFYGLYTGLAYLTPFFGGMIADRYLGQRKSVYWGGLLMAAGHLLMASEHFFLLALLLLVMGNGFFKPNISTQVGGLYAEGDERRDRAYTIFYMGVNLGAFFSPLVCGTLGQKVGWHWGFGSAGIGMIIGLMIYHWGRRYLPQQFNSTASEIQSMREHSKLEKADWKRIMALVYLCTINIFFWGVYEQQGNTLQIWADENVNWDFFGWQMPSTWFQSFNPLLIFIFAPILNLVWSWQSKKVKEPGSVAKMGIGCLWAGMAYLFMIVVLQSVGATKVHWMVLMGCVFFFTIGELYISPIGLSLVSKLSPTRLISTMMGVWFMSSFFGNYMSGAVGMYYSRMSEQNFFLMLAGLSLAASVLFFAAVKPLRETMKGH